ncbi:MAG: CBS domain-containing protein [Gammaproteobacteria bacterium]|nr:CBS domain-containing protein [Gammaproteobacteria bacterium]MCI0590433.1 CBS domain-containing protein [Gammaproteobacteria bacterium]
MPNPLALEFIALHPQDAARTLIRLDSEELTDFIDALPGNLAAEVLKYMPLPSAAQCLEFISTAQAAAICTHLSISTTGLLIRRVNKGSRKRITQALPQHIGASLRVILGYSEGVIGSVIDPLTLTLPEHVTVDEAISLLKKAPDNVSHFLYVLDELHHVTGMVDVRDLLLTDGKASIQTIMRHDVVPLHAQESILAVANHSTWSIFDILPVIDRKGVYLGTLHKRTVQSSLEDLDQEPLYDPIPGGPMLELAELLWTSLASLLVTTTVHSTNKGKNRAD